MADETNIVYVKHPVTAEQKKALRKKFGDSRFVDSRYAGKGDKIVDATGKAVTASKAKSKAKEAATEESQEGES